jgi:hypothetical protein
MDVLDEADAPAGPKNRNADDQGDFPDDGASACSCIAVAFPSFANANPLASQARQSGRHPAVACKCRLPIEHVGDFSQITGMVKKSYLLDGEICGTANNREVIAQRDPTLAPHGYLCSLERGNK